MPPIEQTRDHDVLVLRVMKAFMQDRGMKEFEESYLPALEVDKKLVLDLSDLDYIDSIHLAALVMFYKKVSQFSGRVVFCGLKPAVRDTIMVTRLDRVFNIAVTRSEALEILRTEKSPRT